MPRPRRIPHLYIFQTRSYSARSCEATAGIAMKDTKQGSVNALGFRVARVEDTAGGEKGLVPDLLAPWKETEGQDGGDETIDFNDTGLPVRVVGRPVAFDAKTIRQGELSESPPPLRPPLPFFRVGQQPGRHWFQFLF